MTTEWGSGKYVLSLSLSLSARNLCPGTWLRKAQGTARVCSVGACMAATGDAPRAQSGAGLELQWHCVNAATVATL